MPGATRKPKNKTVGAPTTRVRKPAPHPPKGSSRLSDRQHYEKKTGLEQRRKKLASAKPPAGRKRVSGGSWTVDPSWLKNSKPSAGTSPGKPGQTLAQRMEEDFKRSQRVTYIIDGKTFTLDRNTPIYTYDQKKMKILETKNSQGKKINSPTTVKSPVRKPLPHKILSTPKRRA